MDEFLNCKYRNFDQLNINDKLFLDDFFLKFMWNYIIEGKEVCFGLELKIEIPVGIQNPI